MKRMRGWVAVLLFLAVTLLISLVASSDAVSSALAIVMAAIILTTIYQIRLQKIEERRQQASDAELEKIRSTHEMASDRKRSSTKPKKR